MLDQGYLKPKNLTPAFTSYPQTQPHLARLAPAQGFVEGAAHGGGVEDHVVEAAPAGLFYGQVHEGADEAPAPMLRFDEDVQDVAARGLGRMRWVGRPVDDHHAQIFPPLPPPSKPPSMPPAPSATDGHT
jgi:hypothetical protein